MAVWVYLTTRNKEWREYLCHEFFLSQVIPGLSHLLCKLGKGAGNGILLYWRLRSTDDLDCIVDFRN
jgi:hypothetical protein